ncbi:hypothetical protein NL676_036970 [Syzygium grande]|nr:hypothetical protein NL676_036970 [Syzygium grande]
MAAGGLLPVTCRCTSDGGKHIAEPARAAAGGSARNGKTATLRPTAPASHDEILKQGGAPLNRDQVPEDEVICSDHALDDDDDGLGDGLAGDLLTVEDAEEKGSL